MKPDFEGLCDRNFYKTRWGKFFREKYFRKLFIQESASELKNISLDLVFCYFLSKEQPQNKPKIAFNSHLD